LATTSQGRNQAKCKTGRDVHAKGRPVLAGHQGLEVVHQPETQPGTGHSPDRHQERVTHGSGNSEPAALLTHLHLQPLLTAVITPATHYPQGLIDIHLGKGRSLLIRCSLQGLAASAEQRLAGAAAAQVGQTSISTPGRQ
jgi:hypothetical protein